jgi:hypothetical protein
MARLGNLILSNAENIIKDAATAGITEAVLHTPVKTGTARINWRVSFQTPNLSLTQGPNTGDINTNRQTASAKALINAANKIKAWKMMTGSNILIINPVSYIGELDQGSSSQAMEGMSIFAIAAIKDKLRKGKLLHGNR